MARAGHHCIHLALHDPGVLALVGTLCILLYALIWTRRYASTPGHGWFMLATLGMAWWLITTAMEISGPDPECKMLWSILAWPGLILMPTAWAFFLFEYAWGRTVPRTLKWVGMLVAPVTVSALVFSNPWHWMFYTLNSEMIVTDTRISMRFDHGPLFFVAITYNYMMICAAITSSVMATFRATRSVRGFFYKLLAITLLPIAANIAYLVADVRVFGVDPTPFFFSVSLAGVVWLMLDNRWIDVPAMARDLLYFHSRDPILVVSQDGRLFEANREARAVFHNENLRPGEEIMAIPDIGQLVRDLKENGHGHPAPIIRRELRSFAPRVYPLELLHASRKLGWAIALIDVSAQKDAAEKAQAADLAKSQFLATVSHELRTPLTVINGAVSLLASSGDQITREKMERLVKLAHDNTRSLARLVDDLLDMQRMENAEFSIEMEPLELNQLAQGSLARIENYEKEKDVKLIFEGDDDPLYVQGDRQRLGQVVTNVLSNAIKFCGTPGKVSLKLRRLDDMAQIHITDNGVGIPAGSRDKVFGRFTQVDASDTRNRGGSGLGMHISKQILKHHKGSIEYFSVVGRGTTFIVTLPLMDGTSGARPNTTGAKQDRATQSKAA